MALEVKVLDYGDTLAAPPGVLGNAFKRYRWGHGGSFLPTRARSNALPVAAESSAFGNVIQDVRFGGIVEPQP